MDFLVAVAFIAVWILGWRWIAQKMNRNGKGWFVRHLAGGSAGFFAGVFIVALALEVGVITSDKKQVAEVVSSNDSKILTTPELKSPPVVVEKAKTLGITPREYIERLNKVFKNVGMNYRLDAKGVTEGEVNDGLNKTVGKHAALVISISKVNGEINDITLIGAGDGTQASGLDVMMIASAALASAAPGVDYKEVFAALPALIDGHERTYGGVKLSVMKLEGLGVWFFASPI